MVVGCFVVYVLANNTQVVPYFESCMAAKYDKDDKYGASYHTVLTLTLFRK